MEEGALAKSPLLGTEKLGNDGGQASESYNRDPSSSSFTFVVLICTYIFFLGSYSAGNSVSTTISLTPGSTTTLVKFIYSFVLYFVLTNIYQNGWLTL